MQVDFHLRRDGGGLTGSAAEYRKRRPKIAENMEAEEAMLFNKSYRDYLGLGEGAAVKLIVQ